MVYCVFLILPVLFFFYIEPIFTTQNIEFIVLFCPLYSDEQYYFYITEAQFEKAWKSNLSFIIPSDTVSQKYWFQLL